MNIIRYIGGGLVWFFWWVLYMIGFEIEFGFGIWLRLIFEGLDIVVIDWFGIGFMLYIELGVLGVEGCYEFLNFKSNYNKFYRGNFSLRKKKR